MVLSWHQDVPGREAFMIARLGSPKDAGSSLKEPHPHPRAAITAAPTDIGGLSFIGYPISLSFSSTTCAGGIMTKLSRKPAMPAITGAPAQKGTDQRMPLWKMAGPTI
jgi:hypothetical protein